MYHTWNARPAVTVVFRTVHDDGETDSSHVEDVLEVERVGTIDEGSCDAGQMQDRLLLQHRRRDPEGAECVSGPGGPPAAGQVAGDAGPALRQVHSAEARDGEKAGTRHQAESGDREQDAGAAD